MKQMAGFVSMGLIGWFLLEGVTPAMWWMVGKWVGTGLLTIITLLILTRSIKNRAEQREFERQEALYERQRKKERPTQVQPQIMYMQPAQGYSNQPIQQPTGLIDLPIEKYEWEV